MEINWIIYGYIALILAIITLVYFIIKDMDYLTLDILIEDITEALILSIGWAINFPLLALSNLIMALLFIIFGVVDDDE